MKRLSNIIAIAVVGMMLTGCGLYTTYNNKVETPDNVFGATQDVQQTTGDASLAQMSWREFFTDPQLQQLIEQVLANNTDINSARIAVEQSEASLKMAKMAYLPSLYFSPQGTMSSFDNSAFSKTYSLPLQLSMDIDLFGSITNQKRAAKAVLLQAQMSEQAVRANLISTTAQQYFLLQELDRQLEILTLTDSLWNALDPENRISLWVRYTDIATGRRHGIAAVLVLTGETTLGDVEAAPEEGRPDLLLPSLADADRLMFG